MNLVESTPLALCSTLRCLERCFFFPPMVSGGPFYLVVSCLGLELCGEGRYETGGGFPSLVGSGLLLGAGVKD